MPHCNLHLQFTNTLYVVSKVRLNLSTNVGNNFNYRIAMNSFESCLLQGGTHKTVLSRKIFCISALDNIYHVQILQLRSVSCVLPCIYWL